MLSYGIVALTIIGIVLISGCTDQGQKPPQTTQPISVINISDFNRIYNLTSTKITFQAPPKLRGINYFSETMDKLKKEDTEIKNDFKIIHQVLNADAVRLWGSDDFVFKFVDLAHQEGLQVWLTYQPFFDFPQMEQEEYKRQFASFAKKADEHNVEVLFVGNELRNWASPSIKNIDLKQFIDDLTLIARKNFKGKITYATDDWEGGEANWQSLDFVSLNAYLGTGRPEDYLNAVKNTKAKFNKPTYITEVGSLTISDAEKGGGDYSYFFRTVPKHDEEKQAQEVMRQLDLIYQMGIDGVFVFTWDENALSVEYDKNKYAYGIWDHVAKRPKQAFFEVYRYYTGFS